MPEPKEELCKSTEPSKQAQQLSRLEKLAQRREEAASAEEPIEQPGEVERDSPDRFDHEADDSDTDPEEDVDDDDEEEVDDEDWEDVLDKSNFLISLADDSGEEDEKRINEREEEEVKTTPISVIKDPKRDIKIPRRIAERRTRAQQNPFAHGNSSSAADTVRPVPTQASGEQQRIPDPLAVTDLTCTGLQAQRPPPQENTQAWSNLGQLVARLNKEKEEQIAAASGDQPSQEGV